MSHVIHIGILIFPNVTQLDATGPAQVLSLVPNARIHLLWKSLEPVESDAGFSLVPTTRLADCPALDVVCVPGGSGQVALMTDEEILQFLRTQGSVARYVTSVCTGSLLLGAAGLLDGYRAACHWAFRELLADLGAHPVNARVVVDRNRISGGGVTAGIDFGLMVAAQLAGIDVAKGIQLALEYSPEPPFDCGTPEQAGSELVSQYRERVSALYARRRELIAELRASRAIEGEKGRHR